MLRRIPPALLVSVGISLAMAMLRLVMLGTGPESAIFSPELNLISSGARVASAVLAMVGVLQLASRLRGPQATGAQIAAVGFGIHVATPVIWPVLILYGQRMGGETAMLSLFRVFDLTSVAAMLVIGLGLGLATRRALLAVVGTVVAFIVTPPWFVAEPVYAALHLGSEGFVLVESAQELTMAFTVLYLASVASPCEPAEPTDPRRACVGLGQASHALWLRAVVAAKFLAVGLAGLAASGNGLQDFMHVLTMMTAVVHIVALVEFSRGALAVARSGVIDLWRWSFYAAALLSLWSAGVLAVKLPALYDSQFGDHDAAASAFDVDTTRDYVAALQTVTWLVSCAAVLLVMLAIVRFARRRALDDLRENASVRAGVFVVLVLCPLILQHYGLLRVEPGSGLFRMLMLVIGGATLYTFVMAAQLCAQAAAIVERDPGIPTARVITSAARSGA